MIKTTAILLNSKKYREKDKLLTFFTLDLGRVLALCKSSRTALHRWGCATEPPAFAYVQLYEKNGFYTLTEICTTESLLHDHQWVGSLAVYQFFAHVLHRYTPYAMAQQELFQKAQSTFFQWKRCPDAPLYYLYSFLFYFLSFQGYAREWDRCSVCGNNIAEALEQDYTLNCSEGLLKCSKCSGIGPNSIILKKNLCQLINGMVQSISPLEEELDIFKEQWVVLDRVLSHCFRESVDPYFISFCKTFSCLNLEKLFFSGGASFDKMQS